MCRIARSRTADSRPGGAALKFRGGASKSGSMDLQQGIVIGGAIVTAAAATGATWGACRWWYRRKLLAAAQRLHRSEQGRLFAHQQTMQARKQLESLKLELAAQKDASSHAASGARDRPRELVSEQLAAALAAGDASPPIQPGVSAHGFADTQPL